VSDGRAARRTATRRRRVAVTSVVLLAAVTLPLTCASAHAQSTRSDADRLRITAKRDQLSMQYGAVVTATGTVGVRGDADAATLPVDLYAGRVLLIARPRTRDCPRSAPRLDPPHGDFDDINEARYSETLAIASAFEVSRKLRLCGYLTAKRHTPSGVRTVTVARASTTLTGPVEEQESSGEADKLARVLGGVMAVVFVVGLMVALTRLVIWWIHDTPAARAARRAATLRRLRLRSPAPPPAPPAPSYAVPASPPPPAPPALAYTAPANPPPQSTPIAAPPHPAPAQAARPRRRAQPRDVILDAADKVADTYRDRLQNILEHQDGPRWLHAFNDRRAASFIEDGKPAPRPYDSLEPRAVLTCLARDPAGEQLISTPATVKARQLSGLVNDAVHPKPHAPLTEADGYRAWRLYTEITGIVAVDDPFER
jgi:hypothetical protein